MTLRDVMRRWQTFNQRSPHRGRVVAAAAGLEGGGRPRRSTAAGRVTGARPKLLLAPPSSPPPPTPTIEGKAAPLSHSIPRCRARFGNATGTSTRCERGPRGSVLALTTFAPHSSLPLRQARELRATACQRHGRDDRSNICLPREREAS
jgi:hypothetical protein